MNTRPLASWLAAPARVLALLASPSSAGVITSESATAGTLLQPTDTYVEQGSRLAQDTVNFFAGFDLIDGSAAYQDATSNLVAPVGPTGNGTQFLELLNDAALTLERTDGLAFTLTGFSFGAVPPVGGVFSGLDFGSLVVLFETEAGATGLEAFDFGVGDASGAYGFQSVSGGSLGALGGSMLRLTFLACTYDGSGGCNYSDPVNWILIASAALAVAVGTAAQSAPRKTYIVQLKEAPIASATLSSRADPGFADSRHAGQVVHAHTLREPPKALARLWAPEAWRWQIRPGYRPSGQPRVPSCSLERSTWGRMRGLVRSTRCRVGVRRRGAS